MTGADHRTAFSGRGRREPNAAVYRRGEVVFRIGTGRVLACPVDTGRVLELEGPLALVWILLDEPASAAELVERMRAAEVEVGDPGPALVELVRAGLVVEDDQ